MQFSEKGLTCLASQVCSICGGIPLQPAPSFRLSSITARTDDGFIKLYDNPVSTTGLGITYESNVQEIQKDDLAPPSLPSYPAAPQKPPKLTYGSFVLQAGSCDHDLNYNGPVTVKSGAVVSGNIYAMGPVVIQNQGTTVNGNVYSSSTVSIQSGATIYGEIVAYYDAIIQSNCNLHPADSTPAGTNPVVWEEQ